MTTNLTPAELSALTSIPMVVVPAREELEAAFIRAATARTLYVYTVGASNVNAEIHNRLTLAVVTAANDLDAFGYRFDEDALLYVADCRAYDLAYS